MYITGWHWRHFVPKSGVPSLSHIFTSQSHFFMWLTPGTMVGPYGRGDPLPDPYSAQPAVCGLLRLAIVVGYLQRTRQKQGSSRGWRPQRGWNLTMGFNSSSPLGKGLIILIRGPPQKIFYICRWKLCVLLHFTQCLWPKDLFTFLAIPLIKLGFESSAWIFSNL